MEVVYSTQILALLDDKPYVPTLLEEIVIVGPGGDLMGYLVLKGLPKACLL